MAFVGTLAVNVVANIGRFVAGLRTASRDVTKFTGTVNKSTRVVAPFSSLLSAGLGFGAAYGLIRMGKAANAFAGEMNRSLAIMSDAGPKMRAEMELTARSVAYNTKYSATEAAKAYFYLASAGMTAKQSLAALPAVSRFAQAGNFDLATATDLATDAQSALGLRSDDAAINLKNLVRVTDVLVGVNKKANASVQQFSRAITTKAGVAMRMYGIEIEEGISVLAAFADQGIKDAEAGTKFSIALRDLTTKAITHKKAFKDLGLATYDEAGEVRKLADVIEDLENRFAGLNDESRKATLLQAGFTDKSVSALQALIGYSSRIREWEQDMLRVGGTTKDVSDNVLTKFDRAWNKITASMSTAADSGLAPILNRLAELIEGSATASKGVAGLAKSTDRWTERGEAMATVLGGANAMLVAFETPMRLVSAVLKDLSRIRVDESFRITDESMRRMTAVKDELLSIYRAVIGLPPAFVGLAESLKDPQAKGRRGRAAALADQDRMGLAATDKAKATVEVWKQLDKDREQFEAALPKSIDLGRTDVGGVPMWLSQMMMGIGLGAQKIPETQAARLYNLTRTPLEKYTSGLEDLSRLLSSGALDKFPDVAGRHAAQLRAEYEAGSRREAPAVQKPTFTPAMLRGSLEAYETIIRNAESNRMRDPAEDTAEAAKEMLRLLAPLLQVVKKVERNQTKPGTVETAP